VRILEVQKRPGITFERRDGQWLAYSTTSPKFCFVAERLDEAVGLVVRALAFYVGRDDRWSGR
jgi:predicted RNase H-like HicB family nuclease